jgi:single-strand DNA-binding protein
MALINVTGIIGKDAELKEFTEFSVVSFPLAYTPREKKQDGWVDGETVWFRVSITGKNAMGAQDAYKKGDRVTVTGTLKISTYKTKDGVEKQSLDIRNPTVGIIPSNKPRMKTYEETSGPKGFTPTDSNGWGDTW